MKERISLVQRIQNTLATHTDANPQEHIDKCPDCSALVAIRGLLEKHNATTEKVEFEVLQALFENTASVLMQQIDTGDRASLALSMIGSVNKVYSRLLRGEVDDVVDFLHQVMGAPVKKYPAGTSMEEIFGDINRMSKKQ